MEGLSQVISAAMTTSRRSFLKHASLASFSLWIPKT